MFMHACMYVCMYTLGAPSDPIASFRERRKGVSAAAGQNTCTRHRAHETQTVPVLRSLGARQGPHTYIHTYIHRPHIYYPYTPSRLRCLLLSASCLISLLPACHTRLASVSDGESNTNSYTYTYIYIYIYIPSDTTHPRSPTLTP